MVRALGDERWAKALEAHRRLVRCALVEHDGVEFGTQGDAIFAAFSRASDAVAAAVAAQRALEHHDWAEGTRVRIRLGLHSGEAVTHGDNYVGKEVHRAARICDAGHGGQILVSERTAALVRDSLPEGTMLVDVGEHRLKDMGAPERLFQLNAPGLANEFAMLRSLDTPTNLAAARSSFVGRESELTAIRSKLVDGRLVSLTGVGGAGKTRIAMEVGTRERHRFVDGVFFVDLAPVSDPALLAQTAATSCSAAVGDIQSGSFGGSIEDRLINALAERACLLIVDNCEHLIDDVAYLLDRMLTECPKLTLLTTSREALGLDGEQNVPIPSLALPSETQDADTIDATDAVRLFAERARAVAPTFAITAENRDSVVEVCRRLDGIPLAIELAATRVAHLSVQQIAERLEDRFRLLTGGRRRIQRQQTLGAALDWSHDLLSENERVVFRRLAVFAGGFTLEAAEEVVRDDKLESSVIDTLGSLVAKSLVAARRGDGDDLRYHMLETVRMYALEKLADAGESESVRIRHRDWYLDWLESFPQKRLSASVAALEQVATEIDNLRAAIDWSKGRDDMRHVARLVSHLREFWNVLAPMEGERVLLDVIEHAGALPVEDRIRVHAAYMWTVGTSLNREAGRKHATLVIELSEDEPSDVRILAYAIRAFFTSIAASAPGAPHGLVEQARRDGAEATRLAALHPDREWLIRAKVMRAMSEETLNDQAEAEREYLSVYELIVEDPAQHPQIDQVIAGLTVSRHIQGKAAEALDAAISGLTRIGQHRYNYSRLMQAELAPALVSGGHEDIACELIRDAVEFVRQPGMPLSENHVLGMAGVVEFLRGRPERAARLLAASRTLSGAQATEIPFRTPGAVALYSHYLPLVRASLDGDLARKLRAEGRAMTREEALRDAAEGAADI